MMLGVPADEEDRWSTLPPEKELQRLIAVFDGTRAGTTLHRSGPFDNSQWEVAGSPEGEWGMARVCRIMPSRVLHVIGASAMAEQLRDLLAADAAPGWSLQPLPPGRTPLADYQPHFQALPQSEGGQRGFKQLQLAGFAFGEEIAACPDEVLLAERNIGPGTLARIRQIIGGPPPPATGTPVARVEFDTSTAAGTAAAARLALFDQLTRTRYPDLVLGLAATDLPEDAVTAIAHSLATEKLPPAEPLVEVLLDTLGQHEMLELYRQTHR